MSAPSRADLRYAIKQAEKALRCLDAAQGCLEGTPGGEALAKPLCALRDRLWTWRGEAIALRVATPGKDGA